MNSCNIVTSCAANDVLVWWCNSFPLPPMSCYVYIQQEQYIKVFHLNILILKQFNSIVINNSPDYRWVEFLFPTWPRTKYNESNSPYESKAPELWNCWMTLKKYMLLSSFISMNWTIIIVMSKEPCRWADGETKDAAVVDNATFLQHLCTRAICIARHCYMPIENCDICAPQFIAKL